MSPRWAWLMCCVALAGSSAPAQQNVQQKVQDEILQLTRSWLKNAKEGNRAGLNAMMDSSFIAVTPGGDILTKQDLVPDDPKGAVQQLPGFEPTGSVVRLYGETAVLMSPLSPIVAGDRALNATFVFNKQRAGWKLVALHLSPQ